ncbi:2-hydroxychromene-2-carboxylate isomerase [Kiloniella laminariae]|uniref:2-hydroxychromene-2-carboxylate isomerase n=1 Tax=Kiloniella laminariae TaxID=454162 RepID=A0ABT4LJJ4_9PROT|nr:2-hydroxychromene-2-carboxylate isomerase [Kiloniella laminariae]MCZ4281276.1 2-hydroxychromene-2-carboxylate isomerase [Kiloniella laminariae]
MSKVIDYYHFLLSPWSYLGIKHFNQVVAKHGAQVNYKPIDVMETFENMGGTPPAKRHPARQRFRMDELKRWSDYLNVPMNFQPAFWPADQSLAARMVLAAAELETVQQGSGKLSDAILTAVWAEERNIADETTLAEIATSCGFESDTLVDLAKNDAISARYKATTAEAHARDVFGSPTYIYRDEIFWGQDRIDFLDRALEKS